MVQKPYLGLENNKFTMSCRWAVIDRIHIQHVNDRGYNKQQKQVDFFLFGQITLGLGPEAISWVRKH